MRITLKNISGFALLTLLGLAGNIINVQLYLGVNLIFGSIFVFLVAFLYRPALTLLSAIIVHSYTWVLWGHPYAGISFILEAYLISYLIKKRYINIVLISSIYWIVIGMPLAWFAYYFILGISLSQTTLIILKQPYNELLNAMIASLIMTVFPLRKWFDSDNNQSDKIPLQFVIMSSLMSLVFISSLGTTVLGSSSKISMKEKELYSRLSELAAHSNLHFNEHISKLEVFNSIILSKNLHNCKNIDTYLYGLQRSFPYLHSISLFSSDGTRIPGCQWYFNNSKFETPVLNINKLFNVSTLEPGISLNYFVKDNNIYTFVSFRNSINSRISVIILNPVFIKSLLNEMSKDDKKYFLAPVEKTDQSLFPDSEEYTKISDLLQIDAPEFNHWIPKKNLPTMLQWQNSFYSLDAQLPGQNAPMIRITTPAKEMLNSVVELYINDFSIMLLVTIIALILTSFATRWISGPVEQVAYASSNLPDRVLHESSILWPDTRILEISSLINNYEEISLALTDRFAEILRINATLEEKVANRTSTLEKVIGDLKQEIKQRNVAEESLYSRTEALIEKEQLLNAVTNSTNDLIYYKNSNLRYIGGNQAFADFIGIHPDELAGKTDYDFFEKDTADDIRARDKEMFINGLPQFLHNWTYDRNRDQMIYLNTSRFPLKSRRGEIMGVVGFSRDMTANKILEDELSEMNHRLEQIVQKEISSRREKEQMLITQSRLAAMGEMIGAIAHQWRQPLNTLAITIQDLGEAWEDEGLTGDYLKNSVNMSMRQIRFMSQTIDDFRNFFRPTKKMEVFNIRQSIEDVIMLYSAQLKTYNINVDVVCSKIHSFSDQDDITSIKECNDEDLKITNFHNEFKQVILNLISNAKDAIHLKKNELKLQGITGSVRFTLFTTDNEIYIKVADNGGGIDNSIIDRIFDPYFTTKDQGKGTGLGLYMSRIIVDTNLNGLLKVRNKNAGAEFTIILPRIHPGYKEENQ